MFFWKLKFLELFLLLPPRLKYFALNLMYERKKNFFQDEKFFSFHFGENLIRARHKKCFKRVEFSAELNDLLDPACNTVPMFASRVAFKFIFFPTSTISASVWQGKFIERVFTVFQRRK